MATSVGTVYIDLELNKKKYQNDISSATKTTQNAFSKVAKDTENSFSNTAKHTENAFSSSFGKIGKTIVAAFSVAAITKFTSDCISAASESQSAWTGLKSIVDGTGSSFKEAKGFLNDYVSDGLVPLSNAVTAYKNLAARGYSDDQIKQTLTSLKDAAAFGRQASYSYGEAIQTATEGLKNENSILVDNAGVTKNVAKMWDEYAKKIGTTSNKLTQQQKIQAEVLGIQQETKFQVGNAASYTQTYAGKVAQLSTAFYNLKVTFGQIAGSIASVVMPVITTALNGVTTLLNKVRSVLSSFGLEWNEYISNTASAASSTSAVGKSVDDVGDKSKKTAKKIKNAFSGLDEINVLKTKDDSDSDDDSSSNKNNFGADTLEIINSSKNTSNVITTLIDDISKKINSLDFSTIKEHIEGIGKSIKNIFTDSSVVSSATTLKDQLLSTFSNAVGNIAIIGTNISEGLVGSIDIYLQQHGEDIKKDLKEMFNIGTERLQIFDRLSDAYAEISKVFTSKSAKQIGADIINIFEKPFMTVNKLMGKFTNDVLDLFVTPISDNVGKIREAFDNTLGPIQTVFDTLSSAMDTVCENMTTLYDEHLAPLFDSLKTGISDSFGKFLEVYNTHIAPFIDKASKRFKDLWDNYLAPLWTNLSELFGSIVDWVKVIYEERLKPFIDWFIENVIPVLLPIIDQIGNVVSFVFKLIVNAINGIIGILKGLLDFFLGIFTGDWEKAWGGIKKIFSSVWDGMKTVIKTVINYIKDTVSNGFTWIKNGITGIMNTIKSVITKIWEGIWNTIKSVINLIINGVEKMVNTVIKGLNKILKPLTKVGNAILEAVGIKSFNFNEIKEVSLPRLAQGGWAEANNPRLAIVGDNKREGEIIAPESKIKEQVVEGIKESNTQTNQKIDFTIKLEYPDGHYLIKEINDVQIRDGKVSLLV